MRTSNARPAALVAALVILLAAIGPRAHAQEEDTQAKIRTSIETMIQAIEEGNDPMRNRMFFELRIIGNESVPALVELMKDARVKVREYAIHTVSYIDDTRWIDPTIDVLKNDDVASTRAMACRALARTQDTPVLQNDGRRAIPVLIEALQKDEEAVRMDAAFALGWFGDPVAKPVLEAAAQSSSELVSFFAKGALEDIAHAEEMAAKGGGGIAALTAGPATAAAATTTTPSAGASGGPGLGLWAVVGLVVVGGSLWLASRRKQG